MVTSMKDEIGYHVSGHLTINDLVHIVGLLYSNQKLLLTCDREVSEVTAMQGWHEIELKVIAAHERRVRGEK